MTDESDQKLCGKCGVTKALTDFEKNTKSANGRRGTCKACRNADKNALTEANREHVNARARSNYDKNKEQLSIKHKARRLSDPSWHRATEQRWQRANPDKNLARTHRYNARKLNAFVEDVLLSVLYDRDNGICGICTLPVPRSSDDYNDKPSIDHIIPLSLLGPHSYANTQLAHLICNVRKGAKIPIAA